MAVTAEQVQQLPADRRWAEPAGEVRIRRAADALRANGFDVHVVATRDEARQAVLDLVPEGAQVHSGASVTLDELGITEQIERSGRYDAVRPKLWQLDRATQGTEIRSLGSAPDYMLGSAHAVTETGSIVAASNGGSQLGPYVSGAGRVVLVIGAQKVVSDLDEALTRIESYSYPLEDARAQQAYGIRSAIRKVLILNGETMPGRVSVILLQEPIGF